jgi:hypothetical protein
MVDFHRINQEYKAAGEAWKKFAAERGYSPDHGEHFDIFRHGWMARSRVERSRQPLTTPER